LDNANKTFKEAAAAGNRRLANRHSFSATAEVVEIVSGARLQTRAADLSQKGCYLDTLNPFANGTKVQVRICWERVELRCAAEVRDSQPGMGMGVAFAELDQAQKALIQSWIERLVSPPPADLSQPDLEIAKPATPPEDPEALAQRLIHLLHKKGLLSSSDVATLLRERIL
jgi:hypothetical protein